MDAKGDSIMSKCEYCGKEFASENVRRRFCSSTCRTSAWQKKHASERPNCPRCGSSKIYNCHENWRCQSCWLRFPKNLKELETYVPRKPYVLRKPKPKPIPKISIDTEKMKRMFNVDSVLGIPCFACENLEIENRCDVTKCTRFEDWLQEEIG